MFYFNADNAAARNPRDRRSASCSSIPGLQCFNKLFNGTMARNVAPSCRPGPDLVNTIFAKSWGQYGNVFTSLYTTLLLFTSLYTTLLLFNSLYTTLLLFTSLYTTLLLFTSLNTTLLLFTSLYTTLLLFTSLYTTLLLFTSLYTTLLLFTSLYTTLLLFSSLHLDVLCFISLYFVFLWGCRKEVKHCQTNQANQCRQHDCRQYERRQYELWRIHCGFHSPYNPSARTYGKLVYSFVAVPRQ